MGRNLVPSRPTKVQVSLSAQQLVLLDRLVKAGVVGTSRPEVLKYLFVREIEKLYPDEVKGGPG
jgi:hypothetical protein